MTGQVPAAILAAITADLAGRSGVAAAQIVEVVGEAVEWSDGSLGCPKPGVSYLQVISPGYRVVLEAGGVRYDYRASERGSFFLCSQG